ncbi:MAG: hypothetical protein ABIK97_02860 [candidate division WOR-3 bacterium]
MKRKLLFTILLFGNWLFGQSFFSSRGLGEEILSYDAYQSSLGKNYIFSYENPSFPLKFNSTVTIGNITQQVFFAQEKEDKRFLYHFQIDYVKISIPTFYQTNLGLGLRRRFSQDFDIYSETAGGYYWHIIGKGGINSVSLSLGKRYKDFFSLGFSYQYLFGGSEEEWSFETKEISLTQETIFGQYQGFSYQFSLLGRIGPLQLGSALEIFSPIKYLGYLSVPSETTEKKISLPLIFNFGSAYNFSEYRSLLFGFNFKNWKKIKLDGEVDPNFTSGFLFSLGFSDYWQEKIPFRFGYSENFWYLLTKAGKRIGESSLNFGTSIKIPKFGFFDLNLETFYRRGDALKEFGIKILFSPRYDETWKKRERRWGY